MRTAGKVDLRNTRRQRISEQRPIPRLFLWVIFLVLVGGVARLSPTQALAQVIPSTHFDAGTQTLIANADHVVFLIPFSHWDTDWHDTFDNYSRFADQNIVKAIQIAKQYPKFRYTLEQVLFVQHFWATHPEYHDDLKMLVQNHQFSFAWDGITQPETSLVAPAVQVHNLQLGRDWISQTFGADYIGSSAWQSDAFGNSAALPTFLTQSNVPYLYIGRWQGKCDPDYQTCQPLPPAFYWTSPAGSPNATGRVLVTYLAYDTAWADIYHRTDPDAQLKELRNTTDAEFKQTASKFLFLPVGFDFADPQANLPALVDRWNAADQHTILVMADPQSAFQYLATQKVPEISTDMNPIWQAFYDTRPDAKIADKEAEYYLTAADKFGVLFNPKAAQAPDWNLAAFNAHYDNIAGVSFDAVWNNSQHPRYQQTLADAQSDLVSTLAPVVAAVVAPLVVFNPTSWSRSEVVELTGDNLPDVAKLPQPMQQIGKNDIAFLAKNVPPLGYIGLSGGAANPDYPTNVNQTGSQMTLSNGLVSVTLDGDHGGTFSSLMRAYSATPSQEFLTGFGDNVTYLSDKGDVYGASFGPEQGRESTVSAQLSIVAHGPLIARAQATFTLGGQQVVKTVTLRADSPLIEVSVDISTLPNTTALVETPTMLDSSVRTDDLGFGAFSHSIDTRPIVSGDVTYRRAIFYPIMYWSDVSTGGGGLTIITHGLQGVAGGALRSFMLVRDASIDKEGVTDPGIHHLRYAYFPHAGAASDSQPWLNAYAFNQPLIAGWQTGDRVNLQLPFDSNVSARQIEATTTTTPLPNSFSSLLAQGAIIADMYRQNDQTKAVVLNYNPTVPATIQNGDRIIAVPQSAFSLLSISTITQPQRTSH